MNKKTLNYDSLIQESAESLKLRMSNKSQSVRSRQRLEYLYLLKTGECSTQESAGLRIGLKGRQSQRLWSIYQKGGLESFVGNPYKGGNNQLMTAAQDEELLLYLDKDQSISLVQIVAYVYQTFQVKYSISGMSLKLKRLKVKAKTGRPVNVRKDIAGEITFKKTLQT